MGGRLVYIATHLPTNTAMDVSITHDVRDGTPTYRIYRLVDVGNG
jgi:hypothetical protein